MFEKGKKQQTVHLQPGNTKNDAHLIMPTRPRENGVCVACGGLIGEAGKIPDPNMQ
ncbi:hypothetical protein AAE478_006755 [Parahypoxylon ruwenzoriense]